MTPFWLFIGTLLVVAVVFARLLRVAARWGRELIELQQHGIEVTGTVLEKREFRGKGNAGRSIRYEYTDQFGKTHRRKVLVTPEAWEAHQENGPILVVYSERRPNVSAPKYLVNLMSRAREGEIRIRVDPPPSH